VTKFVSYNAPTTTNVCLYKYLSY